MRVTLCCTQPRCSLSAQRKGVGAEPMAPDATWSMASTGAGALSWSMPGGSYSLNASAEAVVRPQWGVWTVWESPHLLQVSARREAAKGRRAGMEPRLRHSALPRTSVLGTVARHPTSGGFSLATRPKVRQPCDSTAEKLRRPRSPVWRFVTQVGKPAGLSGGTDWHGSPHPTRPEPHHQWSVLPVLCHGGARLSREHREGVQ